jgi:DNA polymerase (family 10)
MPTKTPGKIALERAQKTAEAIIKRLEPYCKKREDGKPYIQVAGSIRRRRPWVNDVDLILIPSDLWNLHHEIMGLGQTQAAGGKIMRVMVGSIQVDIYIASEETWATLLLIRTGSADNNIRLCSRARELNWQLHADGSGLFDQNGKRIAGDTELSIYNALGLKWQEPWERN